MLMPAAVYKKMKQYNESKRKKHKGKLVLNGKNCLHGSECKMLRLFRRYCVGTENKKEKGEMKQEKG